MSGAREEILRDDALLALFQREPSRAWDQFLDRYAATIFRHIQRLRFDYDSAMDAFTYVCEKLAENDFRRMRAIRHTGASGELTPWLLKVVERLSISWVWSRDGRQRLFKPIARLGPREQRVFELHFRRGLTPLAIHEQLRAELHEEIEPAEVFEALEKIHAALSPTKRWRLLSHLARLRGALSLDELRDDPFAPFEPAAAAPDPESGLISREEEARVERVIARLAPRLRLIVQFRYDDGLEIDEIAQILHVTAREVRESLACAAKELRRIMDEAGS